MNYHSDCRSCNLWNFNGSSCEHVFREFVVISGDCWHPVGTVLVRGEVQEWVGE